MAAISRSHRNGQFGPNPTIDQKIEIFRECVLGWQIEIAEEMSRQFFETRSTHQTGNPMRECGFAVVSVIFSYFETIAQYIQGATSHCQSAQFFNFGFREVYPETDLNDFDITGIYAHVRCGMYHRGLTRPGVNLYERHKPTFQFDEEGQLLLNPFTLVTDVKEHFCGYVSRLQDKSNTALRTYFEVIFDDGASNSEVSSLFGSGSGW